MNKTCFVLITVIVAISSASLFAGETMVTRTTRTSTGCDFRVDKCETSVATDPSYMHFKDGSTQSSTAGIGSGSADPTFYRSDDFQDYSSSHSETVDELLALIRSKLSNCPEVELKFDETTGQITLHYLHSQCDCDCDWTVNIRDVKADDFVWKRTSDNYSDRLGQMERRKFHCVNEKDAQDVQSALNRIRLINGWQVTTY